MCVCLLAGMIKKKIALREQSGLIISSIAFKPFPSKQSDCGLPEEVKAERRGERGEPMTRRDKAVGEKGSEKRSDGK